MAEKETSTLSAAANGFSALPVARQMALLIGLAASVAVGAVVVMWSVEPNYRPLYSDLNSRDASEVLDVLQKSGIDYKVDRQRGTVMVPSEDVHNARMKVASEGLPRGSGHGFEIFQNATAFGSSQFIEKARYRHALEAELARTISNFRNVKTVRVHLAIPKQTAFVGKQRKSTASVFLDLYPGLSLAQEKVAAIVHLVASSVPELASEDVTVVDDNGHLFTEAGGDAALASADRMLNYKRQVESQYARKVQDLLEQILGTGKVKARVSADIDFSKEEETHEIFDPKGQVLRSEQTMEENRSYESSNAEGAPGALSIQALASDTPDVATVQESTEQNEENINSVKKATRHFELAKKVSYKKKQPGRILRLTIAAVLDDHEVIDEKSGAKTYKALTEEELKKFTMLVKDAVGFDAKRGDSVNLINSSFARVPKHEALPEDSIFQKAWFARMAKGLLGGLFVLILAFGVLRPIVRHLAQKPVARKGLVSGGTEQGGLPVAPPEQAGSVEGSQAHTSNKGESFEDQLKVLQDLANRDPKRVAQVVKTWVD